MEKMTYAVLEQTAHAGGASALAQVTELGVAGGEQMQVAPAKYSLSAQENGRATYVFETRNFDGIPTKTCLIDSRTSTSNREEAALKQAIKEGQKTLCRMPHINVTYYKNDKPFIVESDLSLPHRAYDAHIRLGTLADNPTEPIINSPEYLSVRNASPAHADDIISISPITILFGAWDSTRKTQQARFASSVTGEIIGVLTDQDSEPTKVITHRSGARIDPVGASIKFSPKDADALCDRMGISHVSADKGVVSGSKLVIGAIPPGVGQDALDGISVKRIIRSRVLSFATLRTLEFGRSPEGDRAIRCLLAAVALDAMARADAELVLRANAHLVEKEAPKITLYERFGKEIQLAPLSIEDADNLLDEAYEKAHRIAGLNWDGQVLEVLGEPRVLEGVNDSSTEE